MPRIFNSCLKFSFEVVHKIEKGYTIFQIKPYPDLNAGKHIRHAIGLVRSNCYINDDWLKN